MPKTTTRWLPADVYDALEFSAEVYGGIGGGKPYERHDERGPVPFCAIGHAIQADPTNEVVVALHLALHTGRRPDSVLCTDRAVAQVNERLGRVHKFRRVPFKLWARALRIRRRGS